MDIITSKKRISFKNLKVPDGYRIIKLWELVKLSEEGCSEIIDTLTMGCVWVDYNKVVVQAGGSGYLFLINCESSYDSIECAFGVFIKNQKGGKNG